MPNSINLLYQRNSMLQKLFSPFYPKLHSYIHSLSRRSFLLQIVNGTDDRSWQKHYCRIKRKGIKLMKISIYSYINSVVSSALLLPAFTFSGENFASRIQRKSPRTSFCMVIGNMLAFPLPISLHRGFLLKILCFRHSGIIY